MRPEKLNVFLAEDDADDRLFFKEALREVHIDHVLSIFKDGVELMEHLFKTEVLPHIVFLDLNMPKKSGFECLKEIRANETLSDICVAIYSTSSADLDIEKTFASGANVYLKKPSDIEDLRKMLSQVFSINWQYITDGLDRANFMFNLEK